ncbi:MAG: saccharopine dehydrogenase C-terminal domain-containing protein [Candidatus Saccharicenans sp.]
MKENNKRKVCLLGAGLVAGPVIEYLLGFDHIELEIADIEPERARRLTGGHPGASVYQLDLQDREKLTELIARSEVVISLVPYTYHPYVAEICLQAGKHLVTASYVSPAMRALDEKAREKGLIFLNELGLDPGIDHMEAMRLIDEIHQAGGKVVSFVSYCGGLPAPEARDNPFGYKFSWSPRGVLLAGRNDARYLLDGQEVYVPAEQLFSHFRMIEIPGLGVFEGYPNRNSVAYVDIYGVKEVKTMLRGTLRYPGWCLRMKKIAELGLLEVDEKEWQAETYADFMREYLGIPALVDLKSEISRRLQITVDSEVMATFEWLGLFSDRPLPSRKASPLDLLLHLMVGKMQYREGERDMTVLKHEIVAEYPAKPGEIITSTLIDFGQPGGSTSMSRTVGLPVAIGVKLILEGRIPERGVLTPTVPEIYRPILTELKSLGLSFKEERKTV